VGIVQKLPRLYRLPQLHVLFLLQAYDASSVFQQAAKGAFPGIDHGGLAGASMILTSLVVPI